MLKFTKLCFAFAVLLLATSCGNDDDAMASAGDLEGTWSAISLVAEIQASTTTAGQSFVSSSLIEGANFDYDVTFAASDWTTNGSYSITQSTTLDGAVISSGTDSYTDVDGSGTYTTSGDEITINGSFFDFDYNGTSFTSTSPEQTANFEINSDGNLVISQNETSSIEQGGAVSATTINSTSIWVRQ